VCRAADAMKLTMVLFSAFNWSILKSGTSDESMEKNIDPHQICQVIDIIAHPRVHSHEQRRSIEVTIEAK
jgi:hypothetical protein